MLDLDIYNIDKHKLAKAFVDKISWEMLRDFLQQHEMTRSNSRENTIKEIGSALQRNNSLLNSLLDLYENIVYFGDKTVTFFKVNSKEIKHLIGIFNSLEINNSIFSENFPIPVEHGVLEKFHQEHGLKVIPVAKKHLENGDLMLLYASSRYFTEQESFNSEWLKESKIKQFQNYSEVIGKRNIYRQAIDFVIIRPNDKLIEIGIDHPDSSGIFSQTIKNKDEAFNKVFDHFNKTIMNFATLNEIGIFRAIKPLFESSEGRLFRAKFLTADGLDDHPNMTNFKTDDYRKAKFFQGGRAQVEKITPYRLSIVWDRLDSGIISHPLLHLNGTKAMLRSPKEYLKEAHIANILSLNDYRFIVNKLFKYINL